MLRFSGALLLLGSLLFLAPLSSPVVVDVFGASDPQTRAEFIANSPTAWDFVHGLLLVGSVVAGLGLVLFANQLQRYGKDGTTSLVGYLSATAGVLGAVLWVVISLSRITREPDVVAANMNSAGWHFAGFAVLTSIAIVLAGFAILRSAYPKWLGWAELALGGLILIVYLIMGDMLPAVFYFPLLLLGIVLLFVTPRQQTAPFAS